jgi:hypothetical protein
MAPPPDDELGAPEAAALSSKERSSKLTSEVQAARAASDARPTWESATLECGAARRDLGGVVGAAV